ncbi:MAG: FAD-binding dehydrogenase [Bacteroidia bacterium]|nr:FAD-binding dehydrogenase [Bacteroidia bacterium]
MQTDVIIIGGGLAGLTAALELLDQGLRVILVDRNGPDRLGGLARWAMGGIFYVDSPFQRRAKIQDSPERALRDWESYAEFEPGDILPRQWAEQYVHRCTAEVYGWLKPRGIRYIPSVQWVERGLDRPGNSVPRFHVVWGTGWALVETLIRDLNRHPHRDHLTLLLNHQALHLTRDGARVTGVQVRKLPEGEPFDLTAPVTIAAAGGITGDVNVVRQHWYPTWGPPPEHLLSGSHLSANGEIHRMAAHAGARVTHLHKQWNYAAGVHHPDADHPEHGLSLLPSRSALWVNAHGERIGPRPLVSGYDTRFLVEQVCRQPGQYSWQILNLKIARKELAVSGSKYNDALREQRLLPFVRNLILGNDDLVQTLIHRCPDVVTAPDLDELARRMNVLTGQPHVDPARLRQEVAAFDQQVLRGPEHPDADEQVRRIADLRTYAGDRLRILQSQLIDDPAARPLMAIREFVLVRKTLGGIQTDLRSRALNDAGEPIPGLYAIGESAGFGGGGIHGLRALEGTFLGNCIFTARAAARDISGKS